MRWVGYAAHIRDIRNAYKISHEILKEETISETRLTWENNTEMGMRMWIGFIWLRTGSSDIQ
jgi:hypothetical protein